MKQLLFILSGILFLTSCSKDKESAVPTAEQRPSTVNNTAALPATFTQKVLLEMYSSAICATCPDAMLKYEQYATQYPGRVYGADVHNYDPMQLTLWGTLDTMLNITAFSTGSFNRKPYNGTAVIPKTMWQSSNMLNTTLSTTATCGLKITSSVTGNQATVKVDAGFKTALTGDYRLTVYLVEDSVTGSSTGYQQANYYNNTPSSPFYQMGNPMTTYKHNCVVRKVLTSNKGAVLSASDIPANTIISKNYTTSTSGYNLARTYVIAFINHNGSTVTDQQILNVQRVKLGTSCNWN